MTPEPVPVNPQDRNDEEYERLARLVSGEAGAEERAASERWVAADPARGVLRDQLINDWHVTGSGGWDVEAGLVRLKQRIEGEAPRVLKLPVKQARPWWRPTGAILKAAAVGVVLVGSGLIWSRMRSDDVSPGALAASASLDLSTAVGERRVMDLPDGSQITLGPSSSVTASVGADGPREVELTGEAFFKVTHDERRPFLVRTSGAIIEDLGTEFTVRAIGGETPVQVAVSSGSVSVRRTGTSAGPDVVLQARDVVTLADTGDLVVRNVDIEAFQAWTSGRLVFRNATFAEAILELERWYPADFQITDRALLQQHVDVEFSGQSLDEVLAIIGRILDVRLVRRGQIVEVAAPERTSLGASNATEIGGGA